MSDKYWHSANLFYCKTYTKGAFRTQSNIYKKALLGFLQRRSTRDIRLSSKYASAYIYIQVSPHRNYILIEYFRYKILFFLAKKNRIQKQSLNLRKFNISLVVFQLYERPKNVLKTSQSDTRSMTYLGRPQDVNLIIIHKRDFKETFSIFPDAKRISDIAEPN